MTVLDMGERICSVAGCAAPMTWRGYCGPHYQRLLRYGDPLGVPQRATAEERFWRSVHRDGSGCWLWTAGHNNVGYGTFWFDGRKGLAHRFAYQQFVGPIPEGLVLDHLCRARNCVNPDHLEPVTNAENIRRGESGIHQARRTHCPQGHPLSGPNLYVNTAGRRECRECRCERRRAYRRRKVAA